MDCQTLVGLPLTGRPWKACFDWQSLVGVPLTGKRWFRQTLVGMPFPGRLWLVCRWLADLGWCGMLSTGRPCLACHWLAGLRWHACVGRPWLAFQFPADLGCETNDWHSLVAMLFLGRAWLACYWLAELGCYPQWVETGWMGHSHYPKRNPIESIGIQQNP